MNLKKRIERLMSNMVVMLSFVQMGISKRGLKEIKVVDIPELSANYESQKED